MSGAAVCAVAVLLAAAATETSTGADFSRGLSERQKAEEREREADIFGEPPPPEPTAAPRPEDSPRRMPIVAGDEVYLGERAGGGLLDRLRGRLADRDDVLTIGGQLLLQLQYSVLEEGEPGDFALRSPNFLDLFVDVRPSDRVRAFAQARVQHDFTLSGDQPPIDGLTLATSNLPGFSIDETQVLLDQLWLKLDAAQRVFFTVGRQRLRWGSGRFFNPTDFVNRQRQVPLALFDQRLGVGLVKIHVPFEAKGANLYGLVDLEDASTLRRIGGALRGEVVIGPAEVAMTAAYRDGTGLRGGLDVSAGIWRLDVRSEVSVTWDDESPYFEGELDLSDPANPVLPTQVDRSRELLVEAMVGADTTFRLAEDGDQLIVGFEYYFNQRGYPNADLYPFLIAAPLIDQQAIDSGQTPPFGGLPALFNPFQVGRHYLAGFASLLGPGRWNDSTFALSAIGNLSDRSVVLRFDYAQVILTFLSLRVFVNGYAGDPGVFKLGFDLPAALLPGAPPDDSGVVTVVAPLFDVGAALTLDF
jgi:hypothetical protein